MKVHDISFRLALRYPYSILSREFLNNEWHLLHVHYYKHEWTQKFRIWFENKLLYKIRNWRLRRT